MQRIGCDLMRPTRFTNACLALDDPFMLATFSRAEIVAARATADPAATFAKMFALKEAVFKCLHLDDAALIDLETRLGRRVTFADLQIDLRQDWPAVTFPKDIAEALAIEACDLSLSYEDDYILASAIMSLG